MPIFKALKYFLVRTLRTFGATFVIFWCELYEHFFFFTCADFGNTYLIYLFFYNKISVCLYICILEYVYIYVLYI